MWTKRVAAFKNLAALSNPIAERTGDHPEEWYHGSPHDFEGFGHPGDYQDQDSEEASGRYKHWNTLIGNHFTSDHRVAKDFSGGEHSGADDFGDDYEGPMGHVVHVKLHMKNPKVYASEHDMDQEVYEHEHDEGNHIDKHIGSPPEDDDEHEMWSEDNGPRHHYAGDSHHRYTKDTPDPNYAYGFHPKATGWLNVHPDKAGIVERYKSRMKRAGYDGIVYGNEYEHSGHGQSAKSAIAFEPHQIEITQHHYGKQNCLSPDEAKRRTVHPEQLMVPGTDDLRRKLPTEKPIDTSKHWPRTWTPSFFENRAHRPSAGNFDFDPKAQHQTTAAASKRYDTGRLWAPLPQECWDRYHGRRTAGHTLRTAVLGDPTDWDTHYPALPDEVHRGMAVKLPMKVRDQLISAPKEQAAQALLDKTQWKATGPHWSTDLDKSRGFSKRVSSDWKGEVPVVLHASIPAREDIETRPSALKRMEIFPYDDKVQEEREVPIRKGRDVQVRGLSWHAEGHPDADESGWVRHDFKGSRPHVASIGEESARQHAGDQTVWQVATEGGIKPLCDYHRQVHESIDQGTNALAGDLGLGQNPTGVVGGPVKGSCAVCTRQIGQVDRALKQLLPRAVQTAQDSRTPRPRSWPNQPKKLGPLVPLKHSENAVERKARTYYHGTANELPEDPTGYHTAVLPAGTHLHPDRKTAWKHAIKHWEDDAETQFPRVYRTHILADHGHEETPGGGIKLKHPEGVGEHQYDADEDPPIKLEGEPEHILYHGTTHYHDDDDEDLTAHDPLEHIHPANNGGSGATFGHHVADPNYAYATKNPHTAWTYAEHRAMNVGGVPHVYRVTPHKPEDLEEDPHYQGEYNRGNYSGDMRSKSGFKVLDEVPMHRKIREQHQPDPDEHEDDDDWGDSHYGMKGSSMLRKLSHDATEDQAIRHCPFCGGGKIIGRADGTVECEFCHNYFTVQTQPQYPNFPQTVNGLPQDIPGMPGQVESPGGGVGMGGLPPGEEDPNAMGGGFPPGAEGEEEAPEEGEEDEGGEEPPPFAKSSFRTATGALLPEEDYARHLAIRLAPDRDAMIARIRRERGATQ